MTYVYVLKSRTFDKFYIGSTEDCIKRLKDHNSGKVTSTKRFRPWVIAVSQEYKSKTEARKIELKLKRLKRKDYIQKIVKDGFIKMGP